MSSNLALLGPLCSLLSSCTWAFGSSAYAGFSRTYVGPAVNLGRALVALPAFAITAILMGAGPEFFGLGAVTWGWLAASIVGSFALGDTLFLLSARHLTFPAAMAIASIYPVWSALAGWAFLGNPLTPSMFLGVILVVIGTVLVILSERSDPAIHGKRNFKLGVLLALGTSSLWCLNAFAISVAGQGVSPVVTNLARACLSVVMCPLVGFALYRREFRPLPWPVVKSYAGIFLVEAYLGSILFIYGISHSPLAISAALSSLAPVIAVGVTWALGRGGVNLRSSMAIVLVVVGIWFLVAFQAS